ncbi:uncharacterized protein At5g39865-like [Bidens hawaiensis]|uniref:uncharacterized protein At5g39865-like n=1 Tax=Bidens hawaiensis TaxID=980011 RepID=UPI0040493219
MGCKQSKQRLCRNCNAQCSPVRRSYSSYSSHPCDDDNSNNGRHEVARTSTTLGYLLLEPYPAVAPVPQQLVYRGSSESDQAGVVEPQTWSKLINEKITKNIILETPIIMPPGEPETINAWELMEGLDDSSPLKPPSTSITKEKVVLYFTSLRGVRKTYEDCCDIQAILKNSGARVDERDVSMHLGFKEELKELLGDRYDGGLPKVFVGRKYIGGADEIRRLHDEFRLDKVLEGCEMAASGDGGDRGGGCEACGDIRFLPCEKCSGSCKIYYEVTVKSEKEESDYGFQRCPDCNENGLIRCPICCD